MLQLTTGSLNDPRATDAWIRLHDAVEEAIKLITPKELAFRLDISHSYLTEALHNLNRKGFRLEWLPTVILMAPIDAVAPILRALADLRGFAVERKRQMTEGEELAATREALKRLAPGVLTLVDKEIGK
jgi:hypothetical protein